MLVCVDVRERNSICFLLPPSLPPSSEPADWPRTDLHLIMHWVSVGSCCCLLILSFTYYRNVLFTNRKRSSRRFIMSLLCVLTNAAGCLPWLPPCRLLPGLEAHSSPGRWEHRLVKKTKVTFRLFCGFNLAWITQKTVHSMLRIGIEGINWWYYLT